MSTTSVHIHLPKKKRGELECISVKTGKNPTIYSACVTLSQVKFVVQPAGRERVRREGKKNVHAYIRGYLLSSCDPTDLNLDGLKNWRQARYNPYQNDTFVDVNGGHPVTEAMAVIMVGGSVYYVLSGDRPDKGRVW